MEISSNQWALLTAPGQAALQVVGIFGADSTLQDKLESRFRPLYSHSGVLRVGHLFDDQNKLIDEIIFEKEGKKNYRLHLHGGAIPLMRLRQLLEHWGCRAQEMEAKSRNLSDEILWALHKATTTQALATALESLKTLPQMIEPDQRLLNTWAYGESLFVPRCYLLVGQANAGKSSLLNRLAGQQRAVVTEIPGTTRDLIKVSLEIGGREVVLIDGAGLRDTTDFLERQGQIFLRNQASEDLCQVLWVVNPQQAAAVCPVANPVALVMTHGDQPLGALPDFEGPLITTGLGDQGKPLKNFIEQHLPPFQPSPVIFTKRQRDFIKEALSTGSWDSLAWRGSEPFPEF